MSKVLNVRIALCSYNNGRATVLSRFIRVRHQVTGPQNELRIPNVTFRSVYSDIACSQVAVAERSWVAYIIFENI